MLDVGCWMFGFLTVYRRKFYLARGGFVKKEARRVFLTAPGLLCYIAFFGPGEFTAAGP